MHETISVRVDADNPDHHLWKNGKTWWIHYTVHTAEGRQRRARYSLHTQDRERARMLRDAVFLGWLREPDRSVGPRPRWVFSETVDPDYRPESYWGEEAIHANVKGEWRRRAIRDAEATASVGEVPALFFTDELPDAVRAAVGQVHPMFMGGEYLPDYLEGEVEIARVSIKSTTGDVFSVRARRAADGIHYRMVDEYETTYLLEPCVSRQPLTLAELIMSIERVSRVDSERSGEVGEGYTDSLRNGNLYPETPDRCRQLSRFVTVDSEYYPDLAECFEGGAERWLARRLAAFDPVAQVQRRCPGLSRSEIVEHMEALGF